MKRTSAVEVRIQAVSAPLSSWADASDGTRMRAPANKNLFVIFLFNILIIIPFTQLESVVAGFTGSDSDGLL